MEEIKAKRTAIEEHAKKKNKPISSARDIKALGITEVDELISLLKRMYS
ncbi:MAG: hypothetical protein JRH08_03320 [Deltaproteobacteria bacterium]|nr:hypothetical protein [Deltaproteobacteria bacterium]MBW1927928.1 hypothetical protein [Deltaproteobacteria bacterium]MBW2024831.1 hypothetical protein [Deltaproteobacteria bacterium]MBW2124729.1 hypothetical protein [Deltaproteobacteria bacterium]